MQRKKEKEECIRRTYKIRFRNPPHRSPRPSHHRNPPSQHCPLCACNSDVRYSSTDRAAHSRRSTHSPSPTDSTDQTSPPRRQTANSHQTPATATLRLNRLHAQAAPYSAPPKSELSSVLCSVRRSVLARESSVRTWD